VRACGESHSIAPPVRNLSSKCGVCRKLNASAALTWRKNLCYPLLRKMYGFQSWSKCLGKTSLVPGESRTTVPQFSFLLPSQYTVLSCLRLSYKEVSIFYTGNERTDVCVRACCMLLSRKPFFELELNFICIWRLN